ncbi:HAD-IB family hydrolase [Paraburkholderia piptadeniae]|uniref:HAD-IB family hydrolase n=1 Tax=Paraburkholderia piptadeniae TaxID=1701573 RepID=UPI000B4050B7|nr:HAD-IB family hydrolase [Paraburkholderia piptadeniae]
MSIRRIVAAFDFDGTITTSDSLRDFVRHAVGNVRFLAGAFHAAPWLIGVLLGVCDRGAAKARFLATTIGGMRETELRGIARSYVDARLPALIRPDMVQRLREHQRCGHEVVLVSASPLPYLEIWAKQVGFDAVLATELEFLDERCTGWLASPNCLGPEKVRRLERWFGAMPPHILYAYGDSPGDREMLAYADVRWLRGDDGALPPVEA